MNTQFAAARPWIGGSLIPAILGVSPHMTPLMAYRTIVGEAPEISDELDAFFEGRKDLESYVRNKLKRKYSASLVAQNVRYHDAEFPFLAAEIDAEESDANWEIKTVSQYAARQWGEENSDDYPMYVAAQANWGLMVRPKAIAWVTPCIGFDDLRRYPVKRDDELIAIMRARAIEFWTKHVVPRNPPPPSNIADAQYLWPTSKAIPIDAPPEIVATVAALKDVKERQKELKKQEADLGEPVRLAFGEADTLVGPDGKPIATWKTPKASMVFNMDKFETDYPQIYAKYLEEKPNSRRLLLK